MDIDLPCGVNNASLGSLCDRYATVITIRLQKDNVSCFSAIYNQFLEFLCDSWDQQNLGPDKVSSGKNLNFPFGLTNVIIENQQHPLNTENCEAAVSIAMNYKRINKLEFYTRAVS